MRAREGFCGGWSCESGRGCSAWLSPNAGLQLRVTTGRTLVSSMPPVPERSLRDISARISALHDQSDVLQLTVDESARLVDADGAILELLDANDGLLHWSFDSGLRGKFDPGYVRGLTLPVGVGLTGRAVADGRVLVAGENLASEFPPSAESDEFFRTTGFESMIAAPVTGECGATGAIEVYSTRPH